VALVWLSYAREKGSNLSGDGQRCTAPLAEVGRFLTQDSVDADDHHLPVKVTLNDLFFFFSLKSLRIAPYFLRHNTCCGNDIDGDLARKTVVEVRAL
jgi:hypothetical protein